MKTTLRQYFLALFLSCGVLVGSIPGASASMQMMLATPNAGVTVPAGCVAWYRFLEGSGTTIADSSGHGNTGTITGTVSWITGPNSSQAMGGFNSTTSVNIGNGSSLQITGNVSISVWYRSGGVAHRQVLLNKNSGTSGYAIGIDVGNSQYTVNINANPLYGGSPAYTNTTGWGASGVWENYVFTYDSSVSSGKGHMYVNGADQGIMFEQPFGTLLDSGASATFGTSDASFYTNDLADLRIYNVTLSSTDVSALYSAGAK